MRTGKRITGSYDEVEDRIRLAILDVDDRPLALWLTQRLANRLVRALVGLLDKEVTEQVAPAAAPQQRHSVQYFQQTSAELRMGGNAPVDAPPGTMLGIVTSVNIKHGGGHVVMEFLCGEEDGVSLPMPMMPMRQMLRVLHHLYRKAEWPIAGIWPEWFDEGAHQELLSPNQVN